ncbi:hypothetical protein LTR37_016058 [Vermiconidia calcicola]|uniref:Uncharacterized protein n=1 Tax=Vermiconidia calcicola TaxID=1690605 RepID=A0ACC3MRU5_9PEZI|nr:hypothetical protein LTR37_016058 [Vermiconidia calcicola]
MEQSHEMSHHSEKARVEVDAAQPPSASLRLLAIPREIRDNIYAHCIPSVPVNVQEIGQRGAFDGLSGVHPIIANEWHEAQYSYKRFWLNVRAAEFDQNDTQNVGQSNAIRAWRSWLQNLGDRNAGLSRKFYVTSKYFAAVVDISYQLGRVSHVGCHFNVRNINEHLPGQQLMSHQVAGKDMELLFQKEVRRVLLPNPGKFGVGQIHWLVRTVLRFAPYCCAIANRGYEDPRLSEAELEQHREQDDMGDCGCCRGFQEYIR